jgi:hypothetical protein
MSFVALSLIRGPVFMVTGLYFVYVYLVLVNWDYLGTFTCWDRLLMIEIQFHFLKWSILHWDYSGD